MPPAPPAPPAAPARDLAPTRPARPDRRPEQPVRERNRLRLILAALVLLAGCVALGFAALHVGPQWLDGAGSVAVLTTYSWALMARTGGRQLVFAALAFAVGVVAVVQDGEVLRSGAAVMTCVVSGVLAVVITVSARTFLIAAREVVLATAVASIGAYATVGFEPAASSVRFEYLTLGLGFLVVFTLVWRFGAGLNGLGTRGLVTLVVGTLLLAASLAYAELFRRYGASGVVQPTAGLQEWSRTTLGRSRPR